MNTLDAILSRRSTRKFSGEPIPKEIIEKVIEAGRYVPSGGNSQTTHFMVLSTAISFVVWLSWCRKNLQR